MHGFLGQPEMPLAPDHTPSNMSLHNERQEQQQEQQQEPRDATEEEVETLRHVVDTIPRGVWIALAVGACERFTFYAVSAPWRKSQYLEPHGDGSAGRNVLTIGGHRELYTEQTWPGGAR
jgi:POT family proton-dependent oligopeptide transporter